jgi:putative spermidine/putrescine transport system permease protein
LTAERQGTRAYWALILPPLAVMAVCYFYPLGKFLSLSVTVPRFGFDNFERLLTSPAIWHIMATTGRICIITTLLALIVGYLIAYVMVHVSPQHRTWMLFVVLLSFWLSVLIRAFAWLTLLQSHGVLNTALMGAGFIKDPLPLTRNEFGVIVGMVHYLIPYAVLPIYANMQGIDRRLVPAARGLGASASVAFLRVFVPLTVPGIIAAALLVFIFSLGFFITPALLGGGKTVMIAEYISIQILTVLDWGNAAALATALLATVFLILAAVSRVANLSEIYGIKP